MKTEREYLTVSQLNGYMRALIDSDPVLAQIGVRGEISNFKRHYASGHLYFSMKDEQSLVKCVMFASAAQRLRFSPKDGDDVLAFGNVSVYPRDGTYQLYVSAMLPAGVGNQYAAFEKLKKKLEAEGLFDRDRKKPIPEYPKTVGLVTSDTGAAVRDLLDILGRRYPCADVILYPALVQGAGAPVSVASGIEYFNASGCADVIIIGRGGGSGEDLSAFNDEMLARTIAASRIPVISAVGHETDFTIADFAADLRAPTPSAAAELCVPDRIQLLRRFRDLYDRASAAAAGKIASAEQRLGLLAKSQVLRSPEKYIELRMNDLSRNEEKMNAAYSGKLHSLEAKLAGVCSGLEAMSPLAVLGRGYGVVSINGSFVSGVSGMNPGDTAIIRMADGSASATITGTEENNEKD